MSQALTGHLDLLLSRSDPVMESAAPGARRLPAIRERGELQRPPERIPGRVEPALGRDPTKDARA
jgi:hypothetical protein